MPELTETGVEFTDLANSLTTSQLKITNPFAPRDATREVSRSSALRPTKPRNPGNSAPCRRLAAVDATTAGESRQPMTDLSS